MSFASWALPAETGDILRLSRTSRERAAPWVLVPDRLDVLMRENMNRYKIIEGRFYEKKHARLSVSKPTFIADGEDHADVMVIPDGDHELDARVKINGEETLLAPGEIVEIRSTEEGTFHIQLDDPLLWSERPRRETFAVLPEEA